MAGVERLDPQLSAKSVIPTKAALEKIFSSNTTVIFVVNKEGEIRGFLTFLLNKIPTGDKVWIEDVEVDQSSRGKGFGSSTV